MCKRGNRKKAVNTITVAMPNNLDQNELKNLIVSAILEAENAKLQQEQEQKEQKRIAWRKAIGFCDYSQDQSKSIIKWFKQETNNIKIFFKLIILSEEKITGNFTTISLLKTILSMFFGFIKFGLYLFAIILLCSIPLQYLWHDIEKLPLYANIIICIAAFFIFVIARFLRIASIEIEKMEDQNYFLGIFASVTSIISITIAIIAIVRGG